MCQDLGLRCLGFGGCTGPGMLVLSGIQVLGFKHVWSKEPTPETLDPNTTSPQNTYILGLKTLNPKPYTLHPTPYTLHPTPYTLHPKP